MALGYALSRLPLYALLWLVSLAVLGLTAFRVEHTRHIGKFFEKIIVELLVTSALTLLWVPYAAFSTHRDHAANAPMSMRRPEPHGNLILWIMWLVGAAIATNDFPTAATRGVGKQSRILAAILALSWIAFALFTLIKVVMAMHYAAYHAVGRTSMGGRTGGVLNNKGVGGV